MDEDSAKGWCKTTGLEKCTGDVTVQSRKQKKFPLYELEIKIKWEGQVWDEQGKVVAEGAGHIKIPDLSEETYDDLEMTVVCDDETKAKLPLKESIHTGAANANAAKKAPPAERFNATYITGSKEATKTSSIKLKYSFAPPPHVMYDTMLDTGRIRGATASDASMSKDVGGKFTMFSGSVEGENVKLTPFSESEGKAQIVWKWRFSTWQPGHFSTVTLGARHARAGVG